MQPAERDQGPTIAIVGSTEEGPALRDASAVEDRAARDGAAAADPRDHHRASPMPTIEPDEAIAGRLGRGEGLHSVRRSAILSVPGGDRALGYGGTLYLTSRRFNHLGQVTVTVQLNDIIETSLAGGRLLLALRSGEGMALDLDSPRPPGPEIAAAVWALR